MKLDELYESLSKSVSTLTRVILLHLIGFASLTFTDGFSYPLVIRLSDLIESSDFRLLKNVMVEFELWSKFPYLLLASVFIYAILFERFATVLSEIPPFRLLYTPTELWRANKPVELLGDAARAVSFPNSSEFNLGELYTAVEHSLSDKRHRLPDLYKSRVEWIDLKLQAISRFHGGLVLISVTFLFFSAVQIAYKTPYMNARGLLMSGFLLLLLACVARARWELYIEKKELAQLRFIADSALPGVAGDRDIRERDAFYRGLLEALSMRHVPGLPFGRAWLIHIVRFFLHIRVGSMPHVTFERVLQTHPSLRALSPDQAARSYVVAESAFEKTVVRMIGSDKMPDPAENRNKRAAQPGA